VLLVEHFLYTIFEGDNYDVKESSGVETLLSPDFYLYLQHLGDKAPTETRLHGFFPEEGVITETYIQLFQDRYHRNYVWNHTLIVKIDDYIQFTRPDMLFNKYFIKAYNQVPSSFKPIVI